MSEVILKLCGGNGIMRQAKNAFVADASAAVVKKRARNSAILNGGLTAVNALNTAANVYSGHPAMATFSGIASGCFGTVFGMHLKDLMQAIKLKKQTSQALKDIINKQDFMDILNRYLRINGKKEMTSEQLMKAYNIADKAKLFG